MAAKAKKRTKQGHKTYLEKRENEKQLWTLKCVSYTQQDMLDTFDFMMINEFGFGQTRLYRYRQKFEEIYAALQKVRNGDTDDMEYSIEVVERVLRKGWGDKYVPRDERYKITIVNNNGDEIVL